MLSCKVYVTTRFVFFVFLSRIYYWYDERGKKTKCTAPQYVDFVMSLCQKLVTDEEIFPTKYGEYPSSASEVPQREITDLLPPAASDVEVQE